MNAIFDESGDHTGRNAAAGSPSDDAGSSDTPIGTSNRASVPSALAIQKLAGEVAGRLEADEREVLAVRRRSRLIVEWAVAQHLRPVAGHDPEEPSLRRVVEGLVGLRHGRRGGRVGRPCRVPRWSQAHRSSALPRSSVRTIPSRRRTPRGASPGAPRRSPSVACGEGTGGRVANQCSERRNASASSR